MDAKQWGIEVGEVLDGMGLWEVVKRKGIDMYDYFDPMTSPEEAADAIADDVIWKIKDENIETGMEALRG